MKYSNSNIPLVCMQTQSTCYNGTSKMNVKGVLWHSTGANNNTIKRYVQPSNNDPRRQELLNKIGVNRGGNDWNHISMQAGLNAWIGKLEDGSVAAVQTMPWDYKPWGCGSGGRGSCNNGWIQFEICEDNLSNADYFNQIYKEACELTAYLCKMYNINPNGSVSYGGISVPTILCHQDSYQLGLGSNHGDVYHWFTKYGKTMVNVRNDVAALMNGAAGVTITPVTTPIVTTTSSTSGSTLLKKGSSNEEAIKALQNKLITLGYDLGKWGADGDFGNATLAAVIKFQKDHQLDVDGVVGPATQAALDKAVKEKKNPSSGAVVQTSSTENQMYRVRLDWSNEKSQKGAFKNLNYAIAAAKANGSSYKVYDASGKQVYPEGGAPVVTVTPSISTSASYSGVMIGSASKDENGRYTGGQAGDQTGKEVYILNWYNQNWDTVLRPTSNELAERIARACETAANNDNIGYSQSDRNSLEAEAKKVGFDLSKITTPCNCDCSSFVSTCCVAAGLSENIFFAGGNGRVTSNLAAACESTRAFEKLTGAKYTSQKDYLRRGDILLNSQQHVVIVLSNGSLGDVSSSFKSYRAQVIPMTLNVRKEPDANAKITTTVKMNQVYTIVDERNGWLKLKSGAGWVNGQYMRKL